MSRLINGLVIFLMLSVAGCVEHEKESKSSTNTQQDCAFYLRPTSGYKCIQCNAIRLGDGFLGPSDLVVIVDMLPENANSDDPITTSCAIPKAAYEALSADDKKLFTTTNSNAFSPSQTCYDAARFLKDGWNGFYMKKGTHLLLFAGTT